MSLLPCLYDVQRPLNQLVPREFFDVNPFLKPWDSIIRPMEELANAMNQLGVNEGSNITTDTEKFQVNIDVQHFTPEEINVKVVNGFIVVEGKHEEKMDQHGYVSRQFVRRYALPKGCLPDTVESQLSSDGVLTITAPKVLALPSTGERIIPITHTGPVKKQIASHEAGQVQ